MVRQIGKLIFFATFLCAEEYYLTYKLHTQDYTIINESIQISKAMIDRADLPYTALFFWSDYETVDDIIKYEKEKIVDTVLNQYAFVHSNTTAQHYQAKIKTNLHIYPVRIKVEINNGLAKIGLYK